MDAKRKVLIADDEEHVCSDLRYIIGQDPRVEIVGAFAAGDEALDGICSLQPDIVFLDINMPKLNGIQLGRYLKVSRRPPYLIYVTAYSEYAVEAFKVGAKGYLLKPFGEADVQEQLDLAVAALVGNAPALSEPTPAGAAVASERIARIAVELDGKYQLLEQQEILTAFAQNRSVFLQTGKQAYLVRFSLAELEGRLQGGTFLRCHRNYLVNVNHVKEVQPWFNGSYLLCLDDGKTKVPVSRAHVSQVKEMFNM